MDDPFDLTRDRMREEQRQFERRSAIMDLVEAANELLARFECVCPDSSGDIDPSDRQRMQALRSALSAFQEPARHV